MATMLNTAASSLSQTSEDRETRIQALMEHLRCHSEQALRQMAERLVDLPEDQAFGQVEYDLRELAHDLAAASHQAGLQAGKKRGTPAPALSAPTARPMPASSTTAQRPG
jgi:hypothetical protein